MKINTKIILGLVLMTLVFSIYTDQKFEQKELIETAQARTKISPPNPLTTDGCTLWPNNFFGNDLLDACNEHDIQYWIGGSEKDRDSADAKLRDAVNKKIPYMGDVMYEVVRVFGSPKINSPWRWGYGFKYSGAYQEPTN